jgi:outer membrane protein OmpA-like peptidoglycan-associated protein
MKSFGAAAGVEGRRAVFLLLCSAVFAAALVRPAPLWAQDREEVPLGTFNLQSPSVTSRPPEDFGRDGDSDGDSGSGANAWFLPGFDFSASGSGESAETMFKKAVAAFDAGRSDEAQGLLEKVIAEAPGSALATKARRYLATLYSRSDDGGPVEIDTGTVASGPRAVVADVKAEVKQQAPRTVNPSAILAKSGGTHVAPSVDEQFLLDAGDRVFFSAGSSELGVRARTVLQAQARFIAGRLDMAALIEGHADDGMTAADEQIRLSQARAEAVRDRLVAEGISPERLVAVARGREAPVSACPDPACAAQNRRAVTVLLSTSALQTLKSAEVSDPVPTGKSTPRSTQ